MNQLGIFQSLKNVTNCQFNYQINVHCLLYTYELAVEDIPAISTKERRSY